MVKINLLIARMNSRIMIPMTAIAAETAAAMIGPLGVGEVAAGSGSEQEVNVSRGRYLVNIITM